MRATLERRTSRRVARCRVRFTDEQALCRNPLCVQRFPRFAMPDSGMCPGCEEKRVWRRQQFALAQVAWCMEDKYGIAHQSA